MPWLVLTLLYLGAPDPAALERSVPKPDTEPEPHRWSSFAQAGAGLLAEDPASVLRLGLRYDGPWVDVGLAVPLWLRLDDQPRPNENRAARHQVTSVTDWESPESYAAMLDELSFAIGGDAASAPFALYLGGLRAERLGFGVILSDLYGALDLVTRRTGARADLRLPTVSAAALADSVVAPHVVALGVTVAPLAWADLDDATRPRLRVALSAALDPVAPVALRQKTVGGGELGVGLCLWRGESVVVETYTAGALLSLAAQNPSVGGHAGLRLEVATAPGRDDSTDVAVAVEGLAASTGYAPAYFDLAYQAERVRVPAQGDRTKAELWRPEGFGLRGRFDVKSGGARFGAAVDSLWRKQETVALDASLYVGLRYDSWSATALLAKREMREWRDATDGNAGTTALLEAAVRVWDGLFLFGSFYYGFRPTAPQTQPVVLDWMAGVGYGQRGEI
jgi:hypothetical protein